ncbi:MAG: type II secretion system protein [Bacilli bacterium]|nr:type II secretion system protein [Bacilli bacterium]
MRRGMTLLETIVCISLITIMILSLSIMIIQMNKNLEMEKNYQLIEYDLYQFEKNFNQLISDYSSMNDWVMSAESISINDKKILEFNQKTYTFYFLNDVTNKTVFNVETSLVYVNKHLIKFESILNEIKYVRYFYIGGIVSEA